MQLQKLYLVASLVGIVALVGCGDDSSGTGGTAGTAGTGGTGGTIIPSDVCAEEFCAADEVLRAECLEFLNECLEENPPVSHDECVSIALSFCGAP